MKEVFTHTNALISETSPYLLQHAHNPVNWQGWSEDAFIRAEKENKPVIISIGYSSCHWCHVMEKESFEDEDTAAIMNEHFICIKVDREERPDIDNIYMDAVQLMTGRGGWPLNCIALPDKRPLYGGTYFPREQWKQVLLKVARLYSEHPDQCLQYAAELHDGIARLNLQIREAGHHSIDWMNVYSLFSKQFDTAEGGMDRAPKFPMPANWEFLLLYYYYFKDENCLKQIMLTLKKMAYGGIYDQAGGGFARYSTDPLWKVPHFEKMLYDNAQLISLYSKAFHLTGDEICRYVVDDTIAFIEREMKGDNGFYSALDADSEGEEGKYYIWTKEETDKLFAEYKDIGTDYFNINERGYWENDHYILLRHSNDREIAAKHSISEIKLQEIIAGLKKKLLAAREKRIGPGIDDKQICSWNALMIKSYLDAYLAFDKHHYLLKAEEAARHFLNHFATHNKLFRIYKNSIQKIHAFLDDYAFAIQAFIQLYSCTGKAEYLNQAFKWMQYALDGFFNESTGLFYYSAKSSESLIAKKTELQDNVIPSSNAVMAENLLHFSFLFGEAKYEEYSKKMIAAMKVEINQHAQWYSAWAAVALKAEKGMTEVIICGKNAQEIFRKLKSQLRPDTLFVFADEKNDIPIFESRFTGDEMRIYICIDKSCLPPVNTAEEALKIMKESGK